MLSHTFRVIFIPDLHFADMEFFLQFEVSCRVSHRGPLDVWLTQNYQTVKQKHMSFCWFSFGMFHKHPICKAK